MFSFTLSLALRKVTDGEFLSREEARQTLADIVGADSSPLQVAALLGALRARGESVDELAGFALEMRERAVPVRAQSAPLVDTCGTGGDSRGGVSTFNISTAAAIVGAAAGAKIAKHGNRAISSRSGSADVLEALGVHLDLAPEVIARCIDTIGVGFMFAPAHHPAMKHVAPIRRELGIRTIFNLLGPLSNPAEAKRQVLGVPAKKWIEPIAKTLLSLGCERALVLHARDGLDEFSTCASTDFIEIQAGQLQAGVFDPQSHDMLCLNPGALEGGSAAENAVLIEQILHDGQGPSADIVCVNAAAILQVADLAPNWSEALKLCRATLQSGAAKEKLAQLRAFTEQYRG